MARKSEAIARLHHQLLARRDALRKALNGDLESFRELASMEVGDNVDAAIDAANDEINSQLMEIESRELEKIEDALARIKQGTYGRCDYCNGPIAPARLNALPYTATCIECQRKSEEAGGFYGRPAADPRWASVGDTSFDDGDSSDVNLNDIEVDISESNR